MLKNILKFLYEKIFCIKTSTVQEEVKPTIDTNTAYGRSYDVSVNTQITDAVTVTKPKRPRAPRKKKVD